jgi:hypothetical protein
MYLNNMQLTLDSMDQVLLTWPLLLGAHRSQKVNPHSTFPASNQSSWWSISTTMAPLQQGATADGLEWSVHGMCCQLCI